MRLLFTTSEFVYGGRPRPRFPLILDDGMEPAQPFHAYLRFRLLEKGTSLDLKTWEAYGRRLWDFAQYLHLNGLHWNQPFQAPGQSVVRVYRDWQSHDLKLEPSTVNGRLKIIADMYRWALERRMIERLPFAEDDLTIDAAGADQENVARGRKTIKRPDVMVDEWKKDPVFLVAEQVKLARAAIRSTSQRLLFDLMARVGLRSVEARTFPRTYVFDPRERAWLKPRSLIDLRLDPREMELKFDKPRNVHVPYSLMEELHTYSVFERNGLVQGDSDPSALILTTRGTPYSKESAIKVFKDLGRKVGFAIRPLMLRHSYAVHTLLLLRAHPEIKLEPLMYVRDRLGHSSVQTTMVYLRQIEKLLGAEALAMMNEFDAMYEVTASLPRIRAPH